MLHEKVWRKYNVSTILILPIFNMYLKHIKFRDKQHTIYSLFFANGLVNAFLYDEEDKEEQEVPDTLKVVFKFDEIKQQISNDNNYYNLLDILNFELVHKTVKIDQYIVIYLRIPQEFKDDIKHIVNSKYSLVSREYKVASDTAGEKLLLLNKDIIDYLILNNFSLRVLIKSNKMKECIKEVFNFDKELGDEESYEYFCLFNKDKEILNEANLARSSNQTQRHYGRQFH